VPRCSTTMQAPGRKISAPRQPRKEQTTNQRAVRVKGETGTRWRSGCGSRCCSGCGNSSTRRRRRVARSRGRVAVVMVAVV
jgi:hypothetical protein